MIDNTGEQSLLDLTTDTAEWLTDAQDSIAFVLWVEEHFFEQNWDLYSVQHMNILLMEPYYLS